jgi:hypothetical protein
VYKVYLIRSEGGNYKIGYTKRNPLQRLKELSTGNSEELDIVHVFESKWGTKIEAHLHRKYQSERKRGEWFVLNDEAVNNFKSECQKEHDMFEFMAKENYWFQKENARFI